MARFTLLTLCSARERRLGTASKSMAARAVECAHAHRRRSTATLGFSLASMGGCVPDAPRLSVRYRCSAKPTVGCAGNAAV